MAHCLILGMTESGKTTLAKQLTARYKYHGIPVIVCDSLCDSGWSCDYQTTDPDEFLRVFWDSRRCVAIIDEAGDAVGKYNDLMQRTATRGRHWGHSVHYISQRGVQISPTVRHQCTRLFLFTSALRDGKVHADEWNAPRLAQCHTFAQGNYLSCTRFGEVTEGSLFGKPWSATYDPDRHLEDGGRELRRGEETPPRAPNAKSQQASNTGSASDRPGAPADPRPGGDTASRFSSAPESEPAAA